MGATRLTRHPPPRHSYTRHEGVQAGEQRTSNFLVWQGAYSELVFVDELWPDFDEPTLRGAIEEYAWRVRRYGGRVEQGAPS